MEIKLQVVCIMDVFPLKQAEWQELVKLSCKELRPFRVVFRPGYRGDNHK